MDDRRRFFLNEIVKYYTYLIHPLYQKMELA